MIKYSFTFLFSCVFSSSLFAQDLKTSYSPIEIKGDISASSFSSSHLEGFRAFGKEKGLDQKPFLS